jgi:hypothetical protein
MAGISAARQLSSDICAEWHVFRGQCAGLVASRSRQAHRRPRTVGIVGP